MKQVEMNAVSEYGEMGTWGGTYYPKDEAEKRILSEYIIPYLNVSKTCFNGECEYSYKDYSGNIYDMTNKFGFILTDGTIIKIYDSHIGYDWDTSFLQGSYVIDINGFKGPNRMGRDVFFAQYAVGNFPSPSLFYFFASNGCKKSSLMGCYNKIYVDSWQIKENYPW